MQIRDALEHDWQTIGAIADRLPFPIAEVDLLRTLSTMQGVAVSSDKQFARLTAPPPPVE